MHFRCNSFSLPFLCLFFEKAPKRHQKAVQPKAKAPLPLSGSARKVHIVAAPEIPKVLQPCLPPVAPCAPSRQAAAQEHRFVHLKMLPLLAFLLANRRFAKKRLLSIEDGHPKVHRLKHRSCYLCLAPSVHIVALLFGAFSKKRQRKAVASFDVT